VLLAAAVVVGNAVLSGASEELLAVMLSFAGGAVLASLAARLCLMPIERAVLITKK